MAVVCKLAGFLGLGLALLVSSVAAACEDDLLVLGKPGHRLILSSEVVEEIEVTEMADDLGILFRLTSEGGARFAELTRYYVGQPLPVRLNGQIVSEPVVREPIVGGSGIFTGFSQTQAEAIVAAIGRDQAPCKP